MGFKGSVSEVCCNLLKHKPMQSGVKENGWDLIITGLRGEESRSRLQAGLRDGLFYLAKSWWTFRLNPINFWSNDMLWYVVRKENIPYAKIYDMIVYEKDEYGNDTDKILYEPRLGCWSCMLTAKYGYFRWLKEFKPKQFKFLMQDKKLGELLFRLHLGYEVEYTEKGGATIPQKKCKKPRQISFLDMFTHDTNIHDTRETTDYDLDNFDPDTVFNWVMTRPCKIEEEANKLS